MNRTAICLGVLAAIVAAAALGRLARLSDRPMHTDEAGNALRLGQFLEDGTYAYDPAEYHGPALTYLTWPLARAFNTPTLAGLTETQLRLLPAVFGVLLVAAAWLLRGAIGAPAALVAAFLTAISPAMLFYSRYYIHESLLVFFTFGFLACLYRCLQAPTLPRRLLWSGLAASCLALGLATKETFVLALLAASVAALIVRFSSRGPSPQPAPGRRFLLSAALFLLVAAGLWAALFSSFGANPRGLADFFSAFSHYLARASSPDHTQPWHYYLRLLLWAPGPTGPWSEGLIAGLAFVGLLAAATGWGAGRMNLNLLRFLALYTLGLGAAYSAIPYKTPWCVLSFLHGLILLAGVGAAVLIGRLRAPHVKALALSMLSLAAVQLAVQAWQGSFRFHSHAANPYAYAPTSPDVPPLAARLETLARAFPAPADMVVLVVRPGGDYWPLPWYLRRLPSVGWYDALPPGGLRPHVLITAPALEPDLAAALAGQLYLRWPAEGDLFLRRGVGLSVFLREDLLAHPAR